MQGSCRFKAVMEASSDAVAQAMATFTEAHRRSLEVLAAAIHRATGDDETICFARAWLLFKWARTQREPRVAAAQMVRRMGARESDRAVA